MRGSSSASTPLLTRKAAEELLTLARSAIARWLEGRTDETERASDPELEQTFGVFVTLRKRRALRGCIGQMVATDPVFRLVEQLAVRSASRDPRFPPLRAEEWPDVWIEVSVVSPLERMRHVEDIEIGRHGVYVKRGEKSGVYLPEVAAEAKWGKAEFVRRTAEEKAGIRSNELDDAEIYLFTTQAVYEKEKR